MGHGLHAAAHRCGEADRMEAGSRSVRGGLWMLWGPCGVWDRGTSGSLGHLNACGSGEGLSVLEDRM